MGKSQKQYTTDVPTCLSIMFFVKKGPNSPKYGKT